MRIPLLLFPRLGRDNPVDSTAVAVDRLQRQLTSLARQHTGFPVLERQARLRLERISEQLDEILRHELSFTQTETWRTVYEAILSDCQVKRYFSVALIEHEDYWLGKVDAVVDYPAAEMCSTPFGINVLGTQR